jgi:hypothetical protein
MVREILVLNDIFLALYDFQNKMQLSRAEPWLNVKVPMKHQQTSSGSRSATDQVVYSR